MKKGNSIKGITLIALVITIIVLLILAGVSIATLTGQNGILTQAQKAKENTELSSEKEGIKLAVQSSMTKNPDTLEITKINLDEGIKEQLGNNREFETTDNKDGSFIVNLKNPDRMYYVDSEGEVISEENMKKISTADELKAFRDNINGGNTYGGWYVYLTNDITLNSSEEWVPIGNENNIFKGIFNGNNFTISNIVSTTLSDYKGMFGFNNGIIKNLSVSGNIKGKNYIGGICGRNEGGTIINCKNFISIESSDNYIGGITGRNNSTGIIKNCCNTGIVKGEEFVGGITGQSNGGPINNCYNIGNIEGSKYIGGIIGRSNHETVVEMCYNSGEIGGDYQIGGIIGYIMDEGSVKNCYNTGNIVGAYTGIGGIVGLNGGKVSKCYNIGSMVGTDSVGAISGMNYISVENCYCPTSLTSDGSQGENSNYSVERLDSEQMKSLEFVEKLNNGQSSDIWKIDTDLNDGYPILQYQS